MDESNRQRKKQLAVLKNKFFANKDAISVTHPHITEWFNGSRNKDLESEIIENCFRKDGNKWRMELDRPYFKESKSRCVCEQHGSLYHFMALEVLEHCIDFRVQKKVQEKAILWGFMLDGVLTHAKVGEEVWQGREQSHSEMHDGSKVQKRTRPVRRDHPSALDQGGSDPGPLHLVFRFFISRC